MLQNDSLIGIEKLFQALCDRTRLRLLSLMADGPVSVGYLAEKLGESQPKTSRHLAYLRSAGLVSTSRDGKWVYYGVASQSDPLVHELLFATLDAVCGKSSGRPDHNETKTISRLEVSVSRERVEQPWAPNEIDVHLL